MAVVARQNISPTSSHVHGRHHHRLPSCFVPSHLAASPAASLPSTTSMRGLKSKSHSRQVACRLPLFVSSVYRTSVAPSSQRRSLLSASSNGGWGGDGSATPERRGDDEYDSMFYTPVESKEASGASPRSVPDLSNTMQQTQRQSRSQIRHTTTAPQSSELSSLRSRYQIRPLPSNSQRVMPPTVSAYDDEDYGESYSSYDSGDDSYNNEQEGGYNGYEDEVMDEGRTVRSTARILPNKAASVPVSNYENDASLLSPKVVRASAKILPKKTFDENPELTTVTAQPLGESASSPTIYESEATAKPSVPALLPPHNFSQRRAKVTPSFMEPDRTKVMINLKDDDEDSSDKRPIPVMSAASNGNSGIPHATTLAHQLEHLESQIYLLNNGVKFNISSPKQVSMVLFGDDSSSTNKDALEALSSAGNTMAQYIFKYRKLAREHKRELKRVEQMERGDKKNDYYGNLARKRDADAAAETVGTILNGEQTQSSAATTPRREPLLLIDASAYIFRSYHAIPPLHRSDGTPTGALHGVCRMLQNLLLSRLLKGDRPRVVLAFDFKGPNFRHEIYPEYKANRGPCPEDLVPQFELVREAAEAFGIVQVEAEGYEADDVIATLARQALEEGVDVDILSGDKDLMQLITPP